MLCDKGVLTPTKVVRANKSVVVGEGAPLADAVHADYWVGADRGAPLWNVLRDS